MGQNYSYNSNSKATMSENQQKQADDFCFDIRSNLKLRILEAE